MADALMNATKVVETDRRPTRPFGLDDPNFVYLRVPRERYMDSIAILDEFGYEPVEMDRRGMAKAVDDARFNAIFNNQRIGDFWFRCERAKWEARQQAPEREVFRQLVGRYPEHGETLEAYWRKQAQREGLRSFTNVEAKAILEGGDASEDDE